MKWQNTLTIQITVISLNVLLVLCEYCSSYVDEHNVSWQGFYCPSGIRLVGKSDVYCCCCTNGRRYCCSETTKSLYHQELTSGREWIQINWPFLMLGGVLCGFVLVIPYLSPRESEVKHEGEEA